MKKTILAVSLFAGLMMTACNPETLNEQLGIPEGAMLITTEKFNGNNSKISVDGTSVQWDGAEKVYLNGNEYTVQLAGDNAYINASESDKTGETYGYTGITGTPTWNSGAKTLSVTVPAEYTSSYSDGRQVIALPMVAYKSATDDKIEFKHVSAAVKVRIKNTTNYILELDKVVVSSNSLQLSGTRDVTLTSSTVANQAGEIATADKSVTVNLAANTFIDKYTTDADIVEVQVPILPVDASSDLTIQVYAHVAGTPAKANTYEYQYAANNDALARNVMITAGVNLGGTNTTPNLKGLFSVSSTKQVFFSKGNLQWGNDTWRFAPTQYTYVGNATNNTSPTTKDENWMDLFCWGANGNTVAPNESKSYNNTTDDISGTEDDWGYQSISNGGNGSWRSMTSNGTSSTEWYYLCGTRNASTVNGKPNARFAKATVNGVCGVILFPDVYTHPSGPDQPTAASINNQTASFATIAYTENEWKLMEAEGAIFLPAAGYRSLSSVNDVNSTGYYWTSTPYSSTHGRYISIGSGFNYTSAFSYGSKEKGYSVRLVQDAN